MKTKYIVLASLTLLIILVTWRILSLKRLFEKLTYSFAFKGMSLSNIFVDKDLDLKIQLGIINPTPTEIVLRKFKLRLYYNSTLIGETIDNQYTDNFSILRNSTTNTILDLKFYMNSAIFSAVKDTLLFNKTIEIEYVASMRVLGIIPITYKDKYPVNKSDFI